MTVFTQCNTLNGGDVALSQANIILNQNYGWYQGSAGIPTSTRFYYTNVSGNPFRISMTDCFCVGDSYSVTINTPYNNYFTFFNPALTEPSSLLCVPVSVPNACFGEPSSYAQLQLDSSFFAPNPLTGLYKIQVQLTTACGQLVTPPDIKQVGYFIRVDELAYTAPFCSFNNSVVTATQTTSPPPAKVSLPTTSSN